MHAKKLLWGVIAVVMLLNAGCGRFCDNWCDRSHRMGHAPCCQPAPQVCVPAPQQCYSPPSQHYSSPPPPLASPPPSSTWQRSP